MKKFLMFIKKANFIFSKQGKTKQKQTNKKINE